MPPNKQHKKRNNTDATDETEFLADNGEDKIRVRIGKIKQFVDAVADSGAKYPTKRQRI
jgi:hypothetical protein